jgi:hypothetical protein
MKGVRRYAVVGCMAAMAGGAWAGPLAPTKASQVVTVTPSGNTVCPLTPNGLVIDTLNKPDATTASFSIPPGSVLVITQVEMTTIDWSAAGDQCEVGLELQTANSLSFLAHHDDLCNARGQIVATQTFPTGAVVKPGSALCVVGFDLSHGFPLGGANAVVHGFFAKDS